MFLGVEIAVTEAKKFGVWVRVNFTKVTVLFGKQ